MKATGVVQRVNKFLLAEVEERMENHDGTQEHVGDDAIASLITQ